jgi:hypothetical protein
MNKQFIPYEQALELKELGFNEECFGCYELAEVRDYKNNGLEIRNEIVLNTLNGYRKYDDKSQTPAPLYQQAFRWFREKYNLLYTIEETLEDDEVWYEWTIKSPNGFEGSFEPTHEEAELACLKKLIEIVKNK